MSPIEKQLDYIEFLIRTATNRMIVWIGHVNTTNYDAVYISSVSEGPHPDENGPRYVPYFRWKDLYYYRFHGGSAIIPSLKKRGINFEETNMNGRSKFISISEYGEVVEYTGDQW